MPCYCPLVHMERGLHGGISGGLGNLSLVFLIVQPQNIHTVGFPAPMLQQSPQNDEWNEALPHHHQYDPIAMNSIMMHPIIMTSECWLGDLDSMHYFSFQPHGQTEIQWWALVDIHNSSHQALRQVWVFLIMRLRSIFRPYCWGHHRGHRRRNKGFKLQIQVLVRMVEVPSSNASDGTKLSAD